MIYGLAILGILLALSAAGNAWQFHHGEKLQAEIGAVRQLATDSKAAAEACSAGVDALGKAGSDRQKALDKALSGVAPKVLALQEASLLAGRAQPSDPGNLCLSLEKYLKAQIAKERSPK